MKHNLKSLFPKRSLVRFHEPLTMPNGEKWDTFATQVITRKTRYWVMVYPYNVETKEYMWKRFKDFPIGGAPLRYPNRYKGKFEIIKELALTEKL